MPERPMTLAVPALLGLASVVLRIEAFCHSSTDHSSRSEGLQPLQHSRTRTRAPHRQLLQFAVSQEVAAHVDSQTGSASQLPQVVPQQRDLRFLVRMEMPFGDGSSGLSFLTAVCA